MFRVAVFPDEISQDFEHAADVAKECGAEALEIRTAWNKRTSAFGAEEVERILSVTSARDLAIAGLSTQVFKCDIEDAEACRDHLEVLKYCMAVAQALDCRVLRIWSFLRLPDPIPWPLVAERFAPAIELAESEDIVLGVENEPTTNAATYDRLATFLSAVNHERVRAVWDPGNDVFAGEGKVPYPDGYAALRPWLQSLHVKDVKRQPQPVRTAEGRVLMYDAVRFGSGEIDYAGLLRELYTDGFDGYLALETHRRASAAPSHGLTHYEQFSHGGEQPTRECLASLHEMIRNLRSEGTAVSPRS